eukprot:TRINITY_DN749_c0_g1_i1.p1 TRINITY_DN749_c0_g1~~TRINITY_DN749_c0_g1_i1.p1  ORF type:complete len:440 (+),score=144.48 TRINITY_DN749_c0_g1_i1:50-1369(+)
MATNEVFKVIIILLFVYLCYSQSPSSDESTFGEEEQELFKKTSIVTLGPFEIKANSSISNRKDRNNIGESFPTEIDEDTLIGLTDISIEILDESGALNTNNNIELHHLRLINFDHHDYICGPDPQTFMYTGNELTNLTLPYPFIYIIEKDDSLRFEYKIKNNGPNPFDLEITDTIFIRLIFTYYDLSDLPSDIQDNFASVEPMIFNARSCYGTFEVPGAERTFLEVRNLNPIPTYTTQYLLNSTVKAGIVYAQGHVDKGGMGIQFNKLKKLLSIDYDSVGDSPVDDDDFDREDTFFNEWRGGKHECIGNPIYNSDGSIEKIETYCGSTFGIKLDELLTVSVTYSNEEEILDAQAVFVLYGIVYKHVRPLPLSFYSSTDILEAPAWAYAIVVIFSIIGGCLIFFGCICVCFVCVLAKLNITKNSKNRHSSSNEDGRRSMG